MEELIFLTLAGLESPRDLLRILMPGSQHQKFWFIWSGTWPGHQEPLSGLLLKWVYVQQNGGGKYERVGAQNFSFPTLCISVLFDFLNKENVLLL